MQLQHFEGPTVPVRTGRSSAPAFTDIISCGARSSQNEFYTFYRLILILCYFECINTQRWRWVSQQPPSSTQCCSGPGHLQYLLHSSLLSFCSSPYFPLLLVLRLDATVPPGTTVRCFAFPLPTPGVVSALRHLHLRESLCVGRLQGQSALCAFLWVSSIQSSQIWTENASTSSAIIMIEHFFPGWFFGFFFFCPLPNLGCLHCKPDSVECWVCLKPALQRWLCPLKPASFRNMECSQLTPWEINCGWFNQPRFWLTDSRDSSCLFWKGQNDCTKITCLALISDSQEHGHLVDFVYMEDVFES